MNRRTWGTAGAVVALVAGGLVATSPAATSATPPPIEITFTGETAGAKPNGYASAESPDVLFHDTMGADLDLRDYGVQSNGLGLGVDGDDASALEIRLSSPSTGISLAFGNDDPGFTDVTDQGQLTLFRNATQVGQVSLNVNSNDVMDQTIGYEGRRVFNRAVFQYVDAAGAPIDLIEIVDDIAVNPLCTITGDDGNNRLVGTSGPDVICGDSGRDTIKAKGGNDIVYPGPGRDFTNAGGGNDTVIDGSGRDVVNGGKGKDDVRGAAGNDKVNGGPGKDRVHGGPGRDALNGGTGRDYCDGGVGKDTAKKCERKRRIP